MTWLDLGKRRLNEEMGFVTNLDELKEFVKPFGLPFYFHTDFAKFSSIGINFSFNANN